MAEFTCSKVNSDRLEDAITKLTTHQLSLSETLHSMTLKLNELIHKLHTPDSPSHSPSSSTAIPTPVSPSSAHRMKLEVPRFDGTEPLGWIFKINQFFEYHSTPDHERLTIASFYVECRALAWFQWMTRNSQLTSWPAFLQALQTRFVPLNMKTLLGLCSN